MSNRENQLYTCGKHPEALAESRCKDCNEYLCIDCSIEHNATHKVVVLKQEAMKFARSVINKTFTPTEEESYSKAVLDKLMELTQSHEELQNMVKQAKQKLLHVGSVLCHEIGELHTKATAITQDMVQLKNTNCNRLCEEIKELVNQRDYFSVYRKKEEFAHIVANRNALENAQLDQLLKQMRKYKKSINKLLASLVTKPASTFDQDIELPEVYRTVGRLEGTVLLYDVLTKRRKSLRPKNVRIHECCEGIEVRGSIYITGGKDDDKDTYELPLDDLQGEFYIRADMVQGRCNHSLCQIKDTYIYCGGGVYDKTTLNKCERYDVDKDEWEEIYSLNESKHNGSMCALSDRYVFFIGGGKIGHTSLFTTIEVLDTCSENGWEILMVETGKSKWVPCECVNSVAISSSEILIFGGWERDKDSRSTCFIYNYATNMLSKTPYKMKKNSAFFYRVAPILYNSKVYAMAPDENIHIFSLKNQEWDLMEADDWKDQICIDSKKSLVLTGRILHKLWVFDINQGYGHSFNPKNHKFADCSEGVVIDGIIYIIGGENDSKATIAVDVRNYSREVIKKADLNVGRYNHAVEGVWQQWIYCCGGCMGREMLSHCEKYSISKNKWMAIPRLNEAKQNISLCACNQDSLYCIGGGLIGHETLFSTVEYLDLRDEERGWTILNVAHTSQWKPLECIGSAQANPYQILLFGGWKPNRDESGKCFAFDIVSNEMIIQSSRLNSKTGFYYTLRPYCNFKKVHAMDPAFNVNTYDIRTKEWEMLKKEDWKEDDKGENERCTIF